MCQIIAVWAVCDHTIIAVLAPKTWSRSGRCWCLTSSTVCKRETVSWSSQLQLCRCHKQFAKAIFQIISIIMTRKGGFPGGVQQGCFLWRDIESSFSRNVSSHEKDEYHQQWALQVFARWDKNDGPGKGFGLENFKMAGLSKVLLHVF